MAEPRVRAAVAPSVGRRNLLTGGGRGRRLLALLGASGALDAADAAAGAAAPDGLPRGALRRLSRQDASAALARIRARWRVRR